MDLGDGDQDAYWADLREVEEKQSMVSYSSGNIHGKLVYAETIASHAGNGDGADEVLVIRAPRLPVDLEALSRSMGVPTQVLQGHAMCLLSVLFSMDLTNGGASQGDCASGESPFIYRQATQSYRSLSFSRVPSGHLLSATPGSHFVLHFDMVGDVGHAVGLSADAPRFFF